MYNYFMLVGIVTNNLQIRELQDGKRVVNIDLAVTREFRNPDGQYDTDFIKISVWNYLIDMIKDSVHKGSKIGVKGRIVPSSIPHAEGFSVSANDLIADRIIFFDKASNKEEIVQDDPNVDNIE